MLVRSILPVLIALSASLRAQTPAFPAPWNPATPDPAVPGLRVVPDHAAMHFLLRESRVVLTGVALPSGAQVDLDLERVDVAKREFRFYVDDVEAPDLLNGLDLSVWTGTVAGMPGSSVMLGFSHVGTRGWIHTGSELVHVMPRPAAGNDWYSSDALLVDEQALLGAGAHFDFACDQENVSPTPHGSAAPTQQGQGQALSGSGCNRREAKVAITTDFPLFQRFNNVAAETAYVATLFSAISAQYEAQVNTTMSFPYVALYPTSNDPWTATSSGAALQELGAAWGSGIPNGARVGQLVSGANLGGGVGYLAVLCNQALSVAGNLAGNTPFPIVQGPSNWDFIVCAHEIGHNFGAWHTHEFCPPVDQCPPSQYWGSCQTAQVCTNQGTIMSYCHLCSGGTSNVIPTFHSQNVSQMLVETNCLPYYTRIHGDHPTAVAAETPITLNATLEGATSGLAKVYYRYFGGPFALQAMAETAPGAYTVTLPAPTCDATLEYYYQLVASCAPTSDPDSAPTQFLRAPVGTALAFADDFQTDTGWTATAAGATAGLWQRGVPVNDPATTFDVPTDYDGSGMCWVTGNSVGNSDVDNGSVTITSPAFDMTGGSQSIRYAYWLRLSSANGTDRMVIEMSSNGTAGPWSIVASHTTDAANWRTNALDAVALSTAGVAFTSNMRLRVTVNDGGTQGTVEAGFDAFEASHVVCNGTATTFCRGDGGGTACPCGNSGTTGHGCSNSLYLAGAQLYATGTPSVAGDSLTLVSELMTGATCVFFQGDAQMSAVPVDDGLGCVTGSVVRLGTKTIASDVSAYPQPGDLSVSVRGALPPAGGTRYYQCFYRNAANYCTSATSNRSNGVVVLWTP